MHREPAVQSTLFGRTADGRTVERFVLAGAGGLTVSVLNFGAVVQSVLTPARDGRVADVVLGYDDLADYEHDRFFVGAVVGRCANRIRRGVFVLDGHEYRLETNDGPNHLHGGSRGFHKAVWDATSFMAGSDIGVVLRYVSVDGEAGYPGNVEARITYTLSRSNELSVDYRATTDAPTPINLAQHSYFNLTGDVGRPILDHVVEIAADRYTPVDESGIPTGLLAPVDGTPFDFREPASIGARIDVHHEQLRITGGYDHNFVLRNRTATGDTRSASGANGLNDATTDHAIPFAARVREPETGRVLEVYTTEPGVQFYAGNSLAATAGKGGRHFHRRTGFCLETQHFPDTPNQPAFPSVILRPGEVFASRTLFRFSAA